MWEFNFIRNTQERFLIPIHCLWLLSRVYVGYIGSKNAENESCKIDISELQLSISQLEKGGYDHFMLKEIFEQPSQIVLSGYACTAEDLADGYRNESMVCCPPNSGKLAIFVEN